jgi:transcriptional regulator with XRE-family HTH domain
MTGNLSSMTRMRSRKTTGKTGKPTLPLEEAERVQEAIVRLRERFTSDQALADAIGVSQSVVSEWRRGNSSPSVVQLDAIAVHFESTEYELRKGPAGSLEIALSYHGRDRWSDAVVRKARDMASRGATHTAQEWAAILSDLAASAARR